MKNRPLSRKNNQRYLVVWLEDFEHSSQLRVVQEIQQDGQVLGFETTLDLPREDEAKDSLCDRPGDLKPGVAILPDVAETPDDHVNVFGSDAEHEARSREVPKALS